MVLSVFIKIVKSFITNYPYLAGVAAGIIVFFIIGYYYFSNVRMLSLQEIDALDGRQFELYLEKLFRALGWYAEVTPASGDQGADLILMKFGKRIAVQAKHYNRPVDNKAVQQVVASKAFYRCTATMVVTNSHFTESAKKLAAVNKVELWDRERLASEITRLATPLAKKTAILHTAGYYAAMILGLLVRFRR